ncbi:hypothetical protein ElyMa_004056100 [Elysia marginata]|uniref:Endonuclease/exonuclease/phosphatase domain-containing protein n=1 Tax=Elysia marginata TaxID=1093978 RepID=A0AAV4G5X2_9GAST|nr:hypothetical protein ElyMa_004056100 [Elysia marginata]
MNLILINEPEDPPSYYSRSWMSTSIPDLAIASEDIALKTSREMNSQLGGSDHRQIILSVDSIGSREPASIVTRWNYRKANRNLYTFLTNEMSKKINACSTEVD